MSFSKNNIGWKQRFKHKDETKAKEVVRDKVKDENLRWKPGTPANPMRHTFSTDAFQRKQRIGYVARQDPSLIRRLRNDIDELSLPQHVVVAKSRAKQDMALTKLYSIAQRHITKCLFKAMFYWKYGALASLQRRTIELEEALDSSNDLNDHLEQQLKEQILKCENMITTEHLTRRKSQKAGQVASTKQNILEVSLAKAQLDLKRMNGQKKYLMMRMRKMGTKGFLKSLWKCNTRAAFRTWQRYSIQVGKVLSKDEVAVNHFQRRLLRRAFNSFVLELMQVSRVANLFARKKRLRKRDVILDWKDWCNHRNKAGFLLGKLMIHAYKRNVQPAFDMLRRQDVILDSNERIANMREETDLQIVDITHGYNGKVLYSMFRIVKQNHKATKARTLRIWLRSVKYIKWEESTHKKVARYILSKLLHAVFYNWKQLVHNRTLARKVIKKACSRNLEEVVMYRLQKGYDKFHIYREWCLAREQACKTIGFFVYRQAMNKVASALSKWVRKTHTIAIHMSLGYRISRFENTFKRRVMIRSFRSWKHVSFNVFQARNLLLGRIRERKYRSNIAVALFLWQRNGAASVIGSKAIESVGRVLRTTVLRLTRKGFFKWTMIYRRDRALENKLKNRSTLHRLRTLNACWEEWYNEVETGRGQYRLALHAANKLTYEFRKRTLLKWRKNVVENKIERTKLKRAAAKILHRQILNCWDIWMEYVDERQYARKLANRVFKRLINGQIIGAWYKWYHDLYLAGRRSERKRADAMWAAFKSCAYRTTRQAFISWKDDVAEHIQLLYLQEKGAKKFNKLRMFSFFCHWKNRFREAKHNRTVLRRAMQRIRNKSLVKSIGSWIDLLDRRDEGRMILSKMCRILFKKRKRNAIVAWRAYLKLMDQLEAKKSIITAHLSRTMSKWLNRDKARVIRTWKDKVNEIQTNRRLVARAMGRWTKRCMYSCWASWVEYANTKVRNRRLIAKIRARWLKQLESKSFRTWFSFLEDRKKLRLKMRKAFEKFKQGSQRKVFMEWKEIPILLKRRKVLMGRIVRRWRKTHLTRGIGKWRTYTVAERILGRKRKPQGAPPPVVEEELSSESALLRRTLERGFVLSASEGIPSYDPLKDKHATYAHTEHYREKQRQLKYEHKADLLARRVKFPGQIMLKELKEERKRRVVMRGGRRSRSNSKTSMSSGSKKNRPQSAPRDRRGSKRGSKSSSKKGGLRGPKAAMEARRTNSLQDLGRKFHQSTNNWTDNGTNHNSDANGANGGDVDSSGSGSNSRSDLNNPAKSNEIEMNLLHEKVLETEDELKHQEQVARNFSKKVKELELQMLVNEQRSQSRTQQLQEVLNSTDEKAQELQEVADNLALELASRKRRAKSQLENAQNKNDQEIEKREELQRKIVLLYDQLEVEKHSHVKREKIVREEAKNEAILIEKEKRKHLIPPSVVKKLERENRKEVYALNKKLEQKARIEIELEKKIELEKLNSQDAIEEALTSAKKTLEAQQHLVRQAEDRSLKNHLVATKMKKVVRDMSVKLEEKVSVMEEEMETMSKQLTRAKRLLKQEKKRNKVKQGSGKK